jgi:uncharacterized membrane protein HdeD (DUF308 family)
LTVLLGGLLLLLAVATMDEPGWSINAVSGILCLVLGLATTWFANRSRRALRRSAQI